MSETASRSSLKIRYHRPTLPPHLQGCRALLPRFHFTFREWSGSTALVMTDHSSARMIPAWPALLRFRPTCLRRRKPTLFSQGKREPFCFTPWAIPLLPATSLSTDSSAPSTFSRLGPNGIAARYHKQI